MKSSLSKKLLDKPYLLWAALFIVVPLIMVVYYAFTDKSGAFSLNNMSQISNYFPTILLSVLYGLAVGLAPPGIAPHAVLRRLPERLDDLRRREQLHIRHENKILA